MGAALAVAGCIIASPPAEPRYFTPRAIDVAAADVAPRADSPELRIRRVRAAPYLRDRMVWRRGVEIGFYDMWRWTETPSRFAQTWLETEMFERRGYRRTTAPGSVTLDARLDAFDELLGPSHEASVSLGVVLSDPMRGTLVDRTFEVRRPISGDDPGAVADALGEALAVAAEQVGDAVSAALGVPPPPPL